MSLNLAHYLDLSTQATPDKTAVIFDDESLSYLELNALAKRVANVLKNMGVDRGEKVAMMIPNIPQFPMLYYGILYAGAVVVPVNCLLKSHEIQYYLEDSDAKVFFAWHAFYDDALEAFRDTDTCHQLVAVTTPDKQEQPREGVLLDSLLQNASTEFDMAVTMPDDTAVILYTSGTTGHPKGAELTQFNLFFNAYVTAHYVLRTCPDDIILAVLPLFHTFGQTCVMNTAIMSGATITLVPRLDTRKVIQVIQRDSVSVILMVPTMYMLLLSAHKAGSFHLSSIRIAVSGGAALPVEVLKDFEAVYGVRILEGYGLSETSPVASFNILDRPSKPASIGLPIWGCEMKIERKDGTFADVGEVGEIVVRGHNVMKGYYKKPVATEETIVNGWLHTGDLAKMDEEGYFFIVDRKKDIIIKSGMNIYPREIEETLYAHPAILEASVIGVLDRIRGEAVKAFVVLKEGREVSRNQLRDYCRERMAAYKIPRDVEFIAELPKGPTGKILKRELRAREG
jgi:long-chain acyl-CoA synthetase